MKENITMEEAFKKANESVDKLSVREACKIPELNFDKIYTNKIMFDVNSPDNTELVLGRDFELRYENGVYKVVRIVHEFPNDFGLDIYQNSALTTAQFPDELKIIYPTLGLNGEAGEVAEKVKKILRDNDGVIDSEKRLEIAKELGDCLWYIAVLSYYIGYNLSAVAEMNIRKLRSRQQRNKISGSGDNR